MGACWRTAAISLNHASCRRSKSVNDVLLTSSGSFQQPFAVSHAVSPNSRCAACSFGVASQIPVVTAFFHDANSSCALRSSATTWIEP